MSERPILVTGGAGFIGSHLVDRLLARGEWVYVADDFSTGSRRNLPHHPRLVIVEADVRSRHFGLTLPHFRQIYNLACPASPVHYQADPIKTMQTNFLGTLNVLELAEAWKARVLQASTSEVYGDPLLHPQSEDYLGNVNPIGPRACYDEGKRAAETLCFDYARARQVDSVVVRIFNTYGPRMAWGDGRVVSSFIAAAMRGVPLRLAGDGQQTRSFCYVDDTVDGLLRAMASTAAGPINIGNCDEITISALARFICRMLDIDPSPTSIVLDRAAVDDPRRRRPDIRLAGRLLDWRPRIGLEEGLQRTIDWMRTNDLSGHSAVAVPA